ncbi:MAG: hypothetical protein U0401_18240 [Anaerolineae bacterium]
MFQAYWLPHGPFLACLNSIGTFATGAKQSDWHAGVENGISGDISPIMRADMMSGWVVERGAHLFF